MLSIPHMIVVFLVVLVVFGPEKLPELARSFGKLMAEFRKASGDFRNAFEEEVRDLERQARIAELKKQAAEAAAAVTAAGDGVKNPPAPVGPGATAGAEALTEIPMEKRPAGAPVITPVAESVPRSDGAGNESASPNEKVSSESAGGESTPTHDQQQPA